MALCIGCVLRRLKVSDGNLKSAECEEVCTGPLEALRGERYRELASKCKVVKMMIS